MAAGIVLSLLHLAPTEADFDRYPAASDARLLAVHMRSVRLPVTETTFAACAG